GDLLLGVALDEPPAGWRIANPERVKPITTALLAGERVALFEEAASADWLRASSIEWATAADQQIIITDRDPNRGPLARPLSDAPPHAGEGRARARWAGCPRSEPLILHPRAVSLGIGGEGFGPPQGVAERAQHTLAG